MIYWLLDNTLAAFPLVLVALVLGRLVPRRPGLVHLAWVAVLVRLVLPPLALDLGSVAAPSSPAVFSTEAPSLFDDSMRWMTRTFGGNWSDWLVRGLLAGWAAGAALLAGRELHRLRILGRTVRDGSTAPARTTRLARRLARRLGVRVPELRVVPALPGPFVWSVRRPTLVLSGAPRGRALEGVLAHELAHLARRDHWTAWLEVASLVLHWWNPVFWIARGRLHTWAELACDAWVLRLLPAARFDYAESLVQAAERASERRTLRPIRALGLDAADLERRLRAVLSGVPPRPSATRHPLSVAAIGAVLVFVPATWMPPSWELVPDYPAGVSADAVLESLGVASWRELLERSDARLAASESIADATERRALRAAALREKGFALMALERFDEAVAVFDAQVAEGLSPAAAAYNAACALSRAGQVDAALDRLWQARALGFAEVHYLHEDPDLAPLRAQPRFVALVSELTPAPDPKGAPGEHDSSR